MSYTTFEISDLRLSKDKIRSGETVNVSVQVQNTGQRAGDEIVQCYVQDCVARLTRPVRELEGFRRVTLQPGETRASNLRWGRTSCRITGLAESGCSSQASSRYGLAMTAGQSWKAHLRSPGSASQSTGHTQSAALALRIEYRSKYGYPSDLPGGMNKADANPYGLITEPDNRHRLDNKSQ